MAAPPDGRKRNRSSGEAEKGREKKKGKEREGKRVG
jgi:hypothetical protein